MEPCEFTRPREWSDEERMYYLLSPFPPSTVIPSLADSKASFWRAIIISSSKELKKLVFSERELCERFRWRGTAPKCLRAVIGCMECSGEVRKLSSYETVNSGWLRWGLLMATRPISWAWRWYWGTSQAMEEKYVLIAVVKELSQMVLRTHQRSVVHTSTDCVMKYSDYQQLCNSTAYPDSADLIRSQLLEERKITRTVTSDGTQVIKFATNNERVSEVDLGILRIKDAIRSLTKEINHSKERSQSLRRQAVQQYKLKNNSNAVHLLRTAKMIQESLRKREGMLENLQSVLVQIQMAETDAKILEAYRSGAAALRAMQEATPLEQAEQVMDNLKELTEDRAQVAHVLGEDLADAGVPVDENELERELVALIRGDELPTLPSPPAGLLPRDSTRDSRRDKKHDATPIRMRDTHKKQPLLA